MKPGHLRLRQLVLELNRLFLISALAWADRGVRSRMLLVRHARGLYDAGTRIPIAARGTVFLLACGTSIVIVFLRVSVGCCCDFDVSPLASAYTRLQSAFDHLFRTLFCRQ